MKSQVLLEWQTNFRLVEVFTFHSNVMFIRLGKLCAGVTGYFVSRIILYPHAKYLGIYIYICIYIYCTPYLIYYVPMQIVLVCIYFVPLLSCMLMIPCEKNDVKIMSNQHSNNITFSYYKYNNSMST